MSSLNDITSLDIKSKKQRKSTTSKSKIKDAIQTVAGEDSVTVADRTLAAWLIKDNKLILSSLDLNIFDISNQLHREPFSVISHFMDDDIVNGLSKKNIDFEFEHNSEEEAEFMGLLLAGVPVKPALLWCSAHQDRPASVELASLMTRPDMRSKLYMVRECGIWLSNASQIEDIIDIEDFPEEIISAAVEDILAHFDAPTPFNVLQTLEGVEMDEVQIFNVGKMGEVGRLRKSSATSTISTTGTRTYKKKRSYRAKKSGGYKYTKSYSAKSKKYSKSSWAN